MTSKSNIRITKIRTGSGDSGDTFLAGKSYRKGHQLVQYSSTLDLAQAYTAYLPESWGDYIIRDVLQELLFRLGAVIGGREPKSQEMAVQEISTYLETQIEYIAGGLIPLDSFIRSNTVNSELQILRALIRQAETLCVAAYDHIELEARDTSEQLLYGLNFSARALNIASDWVFAFVWLYSTEQDGGLIKTLKWVPWAEEKLRGLN